jgi:hypothetical protein
MIYELNNYVSKDDLVYINETINKHIESNENSFARKKDSYRHGKTIYITEENKLQELDKKIKDIISSLMGFVERNYRPGFVVGDSGYEFHRYFSGDVCKVHQDGEMPNLNNSNQSLIRFLSIVIHLNTPQEGGDTVFPDQGKIVKTEAGKVVLFPPYGFVPHYVTKSLENRDVIVTWLVYNGIKAIKD